MVAGSIPDEAFGTFTETGPSGGIIVLESSQFLTEMSTGDLPEE
jgi:hypothetical protein